MYQTISNKEIARLKRGTRYKVTYQSESQRHVRTSVMDYLWAERNELVFNTRPVSGTIAMPTSWIIAIEEVSAETPIHLNRRAEGPRFIYGEQD